MVADVRLMLPALLGLFVDVITDVFLPIARVDATGQDLNDNNAGLPICRYGLHMCIKSMGN